VSATAHETARVGLLKYSFRCLVCGKVFDAFDSEYDPDGMDRVPAVARTPSGEMAAAVLKADPVWDQISDQIYEVVRLQEFSPYGRTHVGGFVHDRIIDPAPSGDAYEFGRPPPCPEGHGSDRVGLVGVAQPLETTTMELPLIRHTGWDAMREAERRALIERAVADFRRAEPELWRRFEENAARSDELRLGAGSSRPPSSLTMTSGPRSDESQDGDHGAGDVAGPQRMKTAVVPETWRDTQAARRFVLVALGFGVPFGFLWSLLMSLGGMSAPAWSSVGIGVAGGLAFGAVVTALMRHPRALLGEAALALAEDEVVLRDGPANHKRGSEMAGGWLWLTDRRVVFRAHALNLQSGSVEIPLPEVTGARTHSLLGFVPTGLRVLRRDHADDIFAVSARGAWVDAIVRAVDLYRDRS
jgi:hypothetical protein